MVIHNSTWPMDMREPANDNSPFAGMAGELFVQPTETVLKKILRILRFGQ